MGNGLLDTSARVWIGIGVTFAAGILVGVGTTSISERLTRNPMQSAAPSATGPPNTVNGREVVATVNGHPIYADDLRAELIRRGADFLDPRTSTDEKAAALDQVVRVEVLFQAADRDHYADRPEIVENVRQLMANRFWYDHVSARYREIAVTDEEVREYYESHRAEYSDPERARAAIIFFRFPPNASEEQKALERRQAREVLAHARAQPGGRTFAEQAAAHSDESGSRDHGGDIGWVAKGARIYKWDPKIIDALFALGSPGDISEPVETARGLFLVRLTDKTGGKARSLEQMALRIRNEIEAYHRRTAADRLYDELRKTFDIRIDRDVLARVGPLQRAAVDGHGPPAFPLRAGGDSR